MNVRARPPAHTLVVCRDFVTSLVSKLSTMKSRPGKPGAQSCESLWVATDKGPAFLADLGVYTRCMLCF